jgi:hypothetical protein
VAYVPCVLIRPAGHDSPGWSPVFGIYISSTAACTWRISLVVPACTAKSLCNMTMPSDSSMVQRPTIHGRAADSNDVRHEVVAPTVSQVSGRHLRQRGGMFWDGVARTYERLPCRAPPPSKRYADGRPIQQSGNRPLGSVNRVPGSVGTVQPAAGQLTACTEPAQPSPAKVVKVTQIDPFLKLEPKMNRICKKFTI